MPNSKKVNSLLDKTLIQDNELRDQVENFLVKEYAKREQNFGEASPYGQILKVLEELNKLQYFYLEDALNERNLETAYKQKSIRGLARLTGHNPYRAISAKGEISLKLKPGASNLINGASIQINNFTKLICENNSLTYLLNLDADNILIPKTSQDFIFFNVIQGLTSEKSFRADGTALQTYTIDERTQIVENDNVRVYVNGEEYKKYESLYDMNKGDKGVLITSGINGQVDITFGNEDYGFIPDIGQTVKVSYLNTQGSSGNLGISENEINFTFDEEVTLGDGQVVDLNEIFDIRITKKITLGSDGENTDLTRFLLNKNSRALVLANPDNYVHFLRRYNQFSFIYAYNTYGDDYLDDDNIVYVFLMPDITKKVSSNSDYFSTNIDNFYIDEDTKEAVHNAVNTSGSQFISAEMEIVDPVVTYYASNIFVRVFDDIVSEEVIREEIIDKMGEYFLGVTRRDKIPKSDIIKIIEEIDGVDSVSMNFISKKNEEAIRNGFYFKDVSYNNKATSDILLNQLRSGTNASLSEANLSSDITTEEKIIVPAGTDPNLGLDEFGDIVIGNKELPIVRGGFEDRNGVKYEDGIVPNNLGAVNVIFTGTVPRYSKYSG